MYMHFLIALIIIVFLSGCAVREPVQVQTKFDYETHKSYTHSGKGSLKGQGFLRQQGGGVVTCAGSEVYLVPATPFFREVISLIRSGKAPQISQSLDPAQGAMLIKQSQCDAQGNFSFNNLPSGNWFVMTEVKWIIDSRQQGGTLLRETSIRDVESQIFLTEKDFAGR